MTVLLDRSLERTSGGESSGYNHMVAEDDCRQEVCLGSRV